MGNMCGCVRTRGPKEECYADPNKAPLSPESKELVRGRRYFQRKKRKSGEFRGPTESLRSRGREEDTPGEAGELKNAPDRSTVDSYTGTGRASKGGTLLSREDSISRGVYVGEVPVLIPREPCAKPLGTKLALRFERLSPDCDKSRSAAEGKLRGISATSRPTKDSLLGKKLLQRQLRRAVSFGAVEHMLRTFRGHDRPMSQETLCKIIWSSQVHRRRRRRSAHTCSVGLEPPQSSAKCISSLPEVNLVPVIYSRYDT